MYWCIFKPESLDTDVFAVCCRQLPRDSTTTRGQTIPPRIDLKVKQLLYMTQLYFVHCAIANIMISGYMLEIANKSKNKYTQLNIGRN